jgi:hypothetical protein
MRVTRSELLADTDLVLSLEDAHGRDRRHHAATPASPLSSQKEHS